MIMAVVGRCRCQCADQESLIWPDRSNEKKRKRERENERKRETEEGGEREREKSNKTNFDKDIDDVMATTGGSNASLIYSICV